MGYERERKRYRMRHQKEEETIALRAKTRGALLSTIIITLQRIS